MKTINVLIVVDVENALATDNLSNNVYLVDSNKHFGSGSEGQTELRTACKDGQMIHWAVTPVSPSNDVEIFQFTGEMINKKMCQPKKISEDDGSYWQGRVESQGTPGNLQYSVVLDMEGKKMTFDPYLVVS
jgi:hypothetical protein